MTQEEWQAATDPRPMLEYLRGSAGDRKLRLWACACCRRIWHLVDDPTSRQGVEVSERYAEGLASDAELDHARREALAAANDDYNRWAVAIEAAGGDLGVGYAIHRGHGDACAATLAFFVATTAGLAAVADDTLDATAHAADPAASNHFSPARTPEAMAAVRREAAAQAALLRCIFGDPFRPVAFDPLWRSEVAVALAAGIYEEGAFERLPILADALEEAGCADVDILSHCREPRMHIRGCWVVDLVLGKA